MINYFYRNIRSTKLQTLDAYKQGAWVYVEDPNPEEIDELVKKFDLEEGLVTDALDEDEMPRMEREETLTYIYSRFPYRDDDGQITTTPVLFILNEQLIITVAQKQLPGFDQLLGEHTKIVTTQRTKLMLQILHQSFNQYEHYLNRISRQIKTTRARLRVEEIRNQDFIDFVVIEDELNDFLSALTPTNSILRRLLLGKHIQLYAEDEDLVEDLMLSNEQSIEACNSSLKTIVNIREAYSTIMSNNLNLTVRLLTVLTVLLAVPTLISSIYGMNVGLPFDDSPFAFVLVTTIASSLSLLMLLIFKKKHWL